MNPDAEQKHLAEALGDLQVKELGLSTYSLNALQRTLVAIDYYLDIYRFSLERALEMCNLSPDAMTLVDYGGGHGIMSILAKRLGFGCVVYVDNNNEALLTARQLSEKMGTTPDFMLLGDAATLRQWCGDTGIIPNALLAMDVIEHIYILDDFFAQLHEISPRLKMVFTTASNPENKRVVHRLRKAMMNDEQGSHSSEGFWQMRRNHIKTIYPDMSNRELDYWADNTRGLIFSDVERAVESQSPNLLLDDYNTCDPSTGSWTERILPLDDYRQLLLPYGYKLTVLPGRYNEYRHGPKLWASRHYNKRIDKAPGGEPTGFRQRRRHKKALKVAPFVYLVVDELNSDRI